MRNVGGVDRLMRFVLGLVLLALAFVPSLAALVGLPADLGIWFYVLVAAGAVMLLTSALRFCPLYTVLGIRTCPAPRD